mgnify:CR=1 FL=1
MLKNKRSIPLDQFINKALYDKSSGYYFKKNPFGKNGDYITSPNISRLFSEMLSIWTIAFWENLKFPKKINLIELGGGNGEMVFQMIKTFEKFPKFSNSCNIFIYEKSPYLKSIQKKKLQDYKVNWIKSFNELNNNPNIFVANEFFDALPIKQFIKKNNKWYERNVRFTKSSKPELLDILCDMNKIEKKVGFKISNKQKFIEYSPLAVKYLKLIAEKINLNNGGILIIDYGYWDNSMKNTIKSISNHKHVDFLDNFGQADITYNINFRIIEKILKNFNLKISGKSNQRNFLINLGILKRAEIISKNLPFSKKTNIFFRLKRLIDKNSMGELFKVILATNKNTKFKTGFVN